MEFYSYGPVEHAQQEINPPKVNSKLGIGIFWGIALTLVVGGVVCLVVQNAKPKEEKK